MRLPGERLTPLSRDEANVARRAKNDYTNYAHTVLFRPAVSKI